MRVMFFEDNLPGIKVLKEEIYEDKDLLYGWYTGYFRIVDTTGLLRLSACFVEAGKKLVMNVEEYREGKWETYLDHREILPAEKNGGTYMSAWRPGNWVYEFLQERFFEALDNVLLVLRDYSVPFSGKQAVADWRKGERVE